MVFHSYAAKAHLWVLCNLMLPTPSNTIAFDQHPLALDHTQASGCGIPHAYNGTTRNETLVSQRGGGLRSYAVHLPSGYESEAPMPLVLSFHGFTQRIWQYERITGFSDESFNPGMITVYPQGLGNPPAWEGAPYAGNESDLSFTTDLVEHLKATYCIDTQRIYANGMSNGGGFVNVLACSPHGSDFAAFAPVAGAFYGDVDGGYFKCQPTRSQLPFLEIHGSNDSIIPYAGGLASGVMIPPITDWLRRWAVRNGCSSSTPSTTRDLAGGHVRQISYDCNGKREIVNGLVVDDLDHYWPSTTPNGDNHNISTWIDAAPYILSFFKEHQKP